MWHWEKKWNQNRSTLAVLWSITQLHQWHYTLSTAWANSYGEICSLFANFQNCCRSGIHDVLRWMLIFIDRVDFDIGAWVRLWINLDQYWLTFDQHWLTSNWPMELTVYWHHFQRWSSLNLFFKDTCSILQSGTVFHNSSGHFDSTIFSVYASKSLLRDPVIGKYLIPIKFSDTHHRMVNTGFPLCHGVEILMSSKGIDIYIYILLKKFRLRGGVWWGSRGVYEKELAVWKRLCTETCQGGSQNFSMHGKGSDWIRLV